jgi:tRNA pseudouridine38-40 synthase
MSRYLIQFSYDGGSFHGYQIQPNAHSVQAELEEKLSLLLGLKVEITGSSRTDTGVHARQQFAHVDLPDEIIPSADFVYTMINSLRYGYCTNNCSRNQVVWR